MINPKIQKEINRQKYFTLGALIIMVIVIGITLYIVG
jgi:hypothetical protein